MRTDIVFTFYFFIVSAKGTDIVETQKDFTIARENSKYMQERNELDGIFESIQTMQHIIGDMQDECFKFYNKNSFL